MADPVVSIKQFPSGPLTGPFFWEVNVTNFDTNKYQVEFRVDAHMGGSHLTPIWIEHLAPFFCMGDGHKFDPTYLSNGQHSFGVIVREKATGKNKSNIRIWAKVQTPVPTPTPDPTPTPVPPTGSPVNTSGKSNVVYENQKIAIAPNYTDINNTPFYVAAPSDHLRLGSADPAKPLVLVGGFNAVKEYSSTQGATHDIVMGGMDISGQGGDFIHIDGQERVKIGAEGLGKVYCHDASDAAAHIGQSAAEHQDGCQIQKGKDIYIGPEFIATWPRTNRLDEPNNGLFCNPAGGSITNLILDRVQLPKWQAGRPLQAGGIGDLHIISPQITDGGIAGVSYPVTLWAPPYGQIHLWRGVKGKPLVGIWANGITRSTVFANGNSGAWPSWVAAHDDPNDLFDLAAHLTW